MGWGVLRGEECCRPNPNGIFPFTGETRSGYRLLKILLFSAVHLKTVMLCSKDSHLRKCVDTSKLTKKKHPACRLTFILYLDH